MISTVLSWIGFAIAELFFLVVLVVVVFLVMASILKCVKRIIDGMFSRDALEIIEPLIVAGAYILALIIVVCLAQRMTERLLAYFF